MTEWLLDTLLATSGLILLVLLVREPVRRYFGARVTYALWMIPAARLFMPTLTHTVERPVDITVTPRLLGTQVSAEPMLLTNITPAGTSLLDQFGGLPTILLTLWLGIAAGLFVARLNGFRRERQSILAAADEIGRIGSIRLVRSSELSGPVAFGILDRVIAVPADFETSYAPHERRLALEHELAHHRSGDLPVNLFAFVLLCLQWFNPLAWIAHAAFRFDQEAACDARVLDKSKAHDRADYGRAIAKAASGRALLFASALDQRKTLHRRLKSMLTMPTAGRRFSGRVMVLAAVAIALPLTATRAISYIDVPSQPVPVLPAATAPAPAPIARLTPLAPAAPVAPVASPRSIESDRGRSIHINGRSMKWSELSSEEKDEIRRSLAEAKAELARTHIDREEIQREVREALQASRFDKKGLQRDLAEARAEIDRAMASIDREAMAASMSAAAEAIAEAKAELEDLQVQFEKDE